MVEPFITRLLHRELRFLGLLGSFLAPNQMYLRMIISSHSFIEEEVAHGRVVLLGSLTLLFSTRGPFPNKISCFVSTCVSLDNSFPSVRQESSFRPWKGSPFQQQMVTLVGLFFTETDILTTRGTQGPACLPMDQTQRPQLGPFCPWSPPDADSWPECPDR